MTTTGRTIVAIILVLGGIALVIVGGIKGGSDGAATLAAGTGFVTLVGGYAFGDRNGEARTAAALKILDAAQQVAGPSGAAIVETLNTGKMPDPPPAAAGGAVGVPPAG